MGAMTSEVADQLVEDDPEAIIASCTDDWFCQERALEHVRAVVAQSGTSFGPGMAILSGGQRDAMHAIYAFCREVDDIADDFDATAEDRQERLRLWREEIDKLYEDGPNWLTTLALLEPIYSFELPQAEFIGMIDGMVMDATNQMMAPSHKDLSLYTRRVAGTVGLLSMRVFSPNDGSPDEAHDQFALDLADAFQLTNILRDIAEDGSRGRLYLPREMLAAHDVPVPDNEEALLETLEHPNLGKVCEELAQQAGKLFEGCEAMLPTLDKRAIRPALVMWSVYGRYLQDMGRRGWRDPLATLRYSKARKLWLAMQGLLR